MIFLIAFFYTIQKIKKLVEYEPFKKIIKVLVDLSKLHYHFAMNYIVCVKMIFAINCNEKIHVIIY